MFYLSVWVRGSSVSLGSVEGPVSLGAGRCGAGGRGWEEQSQASASGGREEGDRRAGQEGGVAWGRVCGWGSFPGGILR